jgi:hypothetical protein
VGERPLDNMPTSRLIAACLIQARVLYRCGQREKITSRGVGDVRREVQGGASMVRVDLHSVTEREGKSRGKAVDSVATSIIINQC